VSTSDKKQDQTTTQEQASDKIAQPIEKNKPTPKSKFSYQKNKSTTSKLPIFIAVLALLLAATGTAFNFWQINISNNKASVQDAGNINNLNQNQQNISKQLQELTNQNKQLNEQISSQRKQLIDLKDKIANEDFALQRRLVAAIQEDTQSLSRKLTRSLNSNRDSWHLSEAESLVRLASVRMQAIKDYQGANLMLQEADNILRKQDDPAAFAAREHLALAMQKTANNIDTTGIYLKIYALYDVIDKLSVKSSFTLIDSTQQTANNWFDDIITNYNNWAFWQQKLSSYIRIDTNYNSANHKILSAENISFSKRLLKSSLMDAGWAVLNSSPILYKNALQQAEQIISNDFDDKNEQVQRIKQQIAKLRTEQIMVEVPDLIPALNAIQNYIAYRAGLRNKNDKNSDAVQIESIENIDEHVENISHAESIKEESKQEESN